MQDLPSTDDLVLASCLVGLLFLVRFALALRRLRAASGTLGSLREDVRRATTPGGHGREIEPDRRHAARQLAVGLFFALLGLLGAAWLAARTIVG